MKIGGPATQAWPPSPGPTLDRHSPSVLAVEARGLGVAFGATHALRGVDLSLQWGERLVVFGPNGAGKTTLLRVLSTLTRPSVGEVRVAGLNPARQGQEVRRLVGLVGHQPYLHPELTASENLRYYGRLYQVPDLGGRVEALLEWVGLYRVRHERVGALSRGMQQRLAIARAVVHNPPLLLLDEPETGLDLQALQLLESVLLADGERPRTVVLTTHNVDRGLRLAGQVAVLVGGRLVRAQPAETLDGESRKELYRLLATGV